MIDISGKNQERLDPETIETYLRQDDVSLAILVYGAEYSKNLSARNNITMREIVVPIRDRLKKGYTLEQIAKELGPDSQNDSDTGTNGQPSLTTISALDLERKTIPPITWIAQGLLPTGLAIWASPPKLGKSWLALLLALSVAVGGRFLGCICCKCAVLYAALEDSERRIKDRMQKILGPVPPPDNLYFTTQAPTLDTGLVDALEAYVKQYPQIQLVIIDTLQKVRGISSGRDVYGKDYADVGALKKFADSHNICVVLVHHLRKMGDDSDPFNRISGTSGISGAADSMWVLHKEKRGDETATLNITGRDVEECELVLQFNKQSFVWESLGNADVFAEEQARQEYQNSPIVQTVKKLLEQSPDGWEGTATQLLDAGTYIAHTSLADSPRALTNRLKGLDKLLLENDGIVRQPKPNGTGGGKHKFYFVDSPQIEEAEPLDFDPFEKI